MDCNDPVNHTAAPIRNVNDSISTFHHPETAWEVIDAGRNMLVLR
jgi:hypothetical protein